MNIVFIGCGFVFDIYMRTVAAHPELVIKGVFDINPARMAKVRAHYGFHGYDSLDAVLADPTVDAIINLTPITAHFEVSKRALEAGKHVFSEKPLTKVLSQSQDLYALAEKQGKRLYAAPANIYADSIRTIFRAVEQGAIGKPLLIYAELDDSPIHLMGFDSVQSPTGAPWPLHDEILEGCTYEHIGYHLVWICGLLGPVISGTAFSSELIEGKAPGLPPRVGTPDYSVACLHFASGATARITCSVVAPRDHKMRIIGREGELISDTYRQFRCPVYLERYSAASLNARKFRTVRASPLLAWLFGIGGRRLKLTSNWKSDAVRKNQLHRPTLRQRLVEWLRRREVYAQDKLVGVAEMAREIAQEKPQYLSKDFILHINELTLLVQGAGPEGAAFRPSTDFAPIGPIPGTEA
jgi:predicted dehydrogenase